MARSGKIIVIDGGDSVGKATQVNLLAKRLENEGVTVAKMDFPRYTQNTYGRLLRECLDGAHGDFMELDPKIAATLYAADRYESKAELEAWLAEGKVVLFDRYVSANMLHQGAKIADISEREKFFDWLDHVEYTIFGMPRPNLTVCLKVAPETSEKLLGYMLEIGQKTADVAEQNRAHQAQVAQCAEQVVNARDAWVGISCMEGEEMRSREAIHEDVYAAVIKCL